MAVASLYLRSQNFFLLLILLNLTGCNCVTCNLFWSWKSLQLGSNYLNFVRKERKKERKTERRKDIKTERRKDIKTERQEDREKERNYLLLWHRKEFSDGHDLKVMSSNPISFFLSFPLSLFFSVSLSLFLSLFFFLLRGKTLNTLLFHLNEEQRKFLSF